MFQKLTSLLFFQSYFLLISLSSSASTLSLIRVRQLEVIFCMPLVFLLILCFILTFTPHYLGMTLYKITKHWKDIGCLKKKKTQDAYQSISSFYFGCI